MQLLLLLLFSLWPAVIATYIVVVVVFIFNQLMISLAVINIIALISRIIRILEKTFHMEVCYEVLLLGVL